MVGTRIMRTVANTIAVLMIALLAAIGPAMAADKTLLNVGMGSADVGTLDPHRSTSTPANVMFVWMFNGLVRFAPGTMDPERIGPDIAEKWDSTPDGLDWTFHLRPGV